MTVSQAAMVLCILGSTFLLTLPDKTTASDKFFQTGGRFGKRFDERTSDVRFTNMQKSRSADNVPPRIERGFYISRYGKRDINSIKTTDSDYFTLCLPSYGMYCDFTGLPNLLRCKRARPVECSSQDHADADEKIELKPETDLIVNNNY